MYSVSWGSFLPKSGGELGTTKCNKGWIASGGGDGKIKIWGIDVRNILSEHSTLLTSRCQVDESRTVTQSLMASIDDAHGVADINCVVWSPKVPGLLASAGDDCVSRIWRVV